MHFTLKIGIDHPTTNYVSYFEGLSHHNTIMFNGISNDSFGTMAGRNK